MEKNLKQIIKKYLTPERFKNDLLSNPTLLQLDSYDWLFIRVIIRDLLSESDIQKNYIVKYAFEQEQTKQQIEISDYLSSLNEKLSLEKDIQHKIELCNHELSFIELEKSQILLKSDEEQMDMHFLHDYNSKMLYTHKEILINRKISDLNWGLQIVSNPFNDNIYLTLESFNIEEWLNTLRNQIKFWSRERKIDHLINIKSRLNVLIRSSSQIFYINQYKLNVFGDKELIGTNYLETFITKIEHLIEEIIKETGIPKLKVNDGYTLERFKTIFYAMLVNDKENNNSNKVLHIDNVQGFFINAFDYSISHKSNLPIDYNVLLPPKTAKYLIINIGILMRNKIIDKVNPVEFLLWANYHIKSKKGLEIKNIELNLSDKTINEHYKKYQGFYMPIIGKLN